MTSHEPLKAPGSPNRVLAVRTVPIAGISEEQDGEGRPTLGAAVRGEWPAEAGAGISIAIPSSRAGPARVWRSATPPTGPPLA